MTIPLVPRVAVIAGVGPGLGAALARRFTHEGCRVGLLARSADYLETLTAELNTLHDSEIALALPCDLADPAQISSAFTAVRARLGPTELLVNNAASRASRSAGLRDMEPEVFERAWRVGVYSAFLCSREAARDMLAPERHTKGGTMLFTGATSSVRGAHIAFSSAKFATRGLAQALARELWPLGIHVAHVVIDGIISEVGDDLSLTAPEGDPLLHPAAIAEAYWHLAGQERSAWTLELDLRPNREKFFE